MLLEAGQDKGVWEGRALDVVLDVGLVFVVPELVPEVIVPVEDAVLTGIELETVIGAVPELVLEALVPEMIDPVVDVVLKDVEDDANEDETVDEVKVEAADDEDTAAVRLYIVSPFGPPQMVEAFPLQAMLQRPSVTTVEPAAIEFPHCFQSAKDNLQMLVKDLSLRSIPLRTPDRSKCNRYMQLHMTEL